MELLYYGICAIILLILAALVLLEDQDDTGEECESDDWAFDMEDKRK